LNIRCSIFKERAVPQKRLAADEHRSKRIIPAGLESSVARAHQPPDRVVSTRDIPATRPLAMLGF
jgi:hypothetical protein